MSHFQLSHYLSQSWLEMPFLVDQFVQRVAPALGITTEELRGAVAKELELESYDCLAAICRLMAEVYPFVHRMYEDVDVDLEVGSKQVIGLTAAVMQAWCDSNEDIYGLLEIDQREVVPLDKLPWQAWVAGHSFNSEDDAKESACLYLSNFLETCIEWRENILYSYTLVQEGTPVGLNALDAAEAILATLQSGIDDEALDRSPDLAKIESVLRARGYYDTSLGGDLRASLARDVQPESLKLDGWMGRQYQALANRLDLGEHAIQVGEFRELFRWLAPELVDGSYEEGPCLWQVLAHVDNSAYVELSTQFDDSIEMDTICPFATAFVERENDIVATLRCRGVGASQLHVVSREEALKMRLPQLAGWYAVTWFQ